MKAKSVKITIETKTGIIEIDINEFEMDIKNKLTSKLIKANDVSLKGKFNYIHFKKHNWLKRLFK